MGKDINVNNNGVGALGLMWVVIITLKLMSLIHWSWLIVVFFPLIVWLCVIVGFAVIAGAVAGLAYLFTNSQVKGKTASNFKLG